MLVVSYAGLCPPEARVEIVCEQSHELETLAQLAEGEDATISELRLLTTNFSGANLMKLCALINKRSRQRRHSRCADGKTQMDRIREAVQQVCEEERVLLGDKTLPRLLSRRVQHHARALES